MSPCFALVDMTGQQPAIVCLQRVTVQSPCIPPPSGQVADFNLSARLEAGSRLSAGRGTNVFWQVSQEWAGWDGAVASQQPRQALSQGTWRGCSRMQGTGLFAGHAVSTLTP